MERKTPTLTYVFYILAALCLVGGIIIAYNLHPGDPGYGYDWKIPAYIPLITAFTAGFIQATLFTTAGKIIDYLDIIANNTAPKNHNL